MARTLMVALLLAPGLALAHGDKAMNKDASAVKMDQGRIASFLHQVNQAEINAGKLAQQQGTSQDVKDYGRMLVEDHTKADQTLTDVAKKAHLNLDKSVLVPDDTEKLQTVDNKVDQVKTTREIGGLSSAIKQMEASVDICLSTTPTT